MSTTAPTAALATPPQTDFIRDLLKRKNLFASPTFFDAVNAMDKVEYAAELERLHERAATVTKAQASKWIDSLLDLPDEKKAETAPKTETSIPAGHYAITGEDGTTDFYRVDRPTKGRWEGYTFVKLQLSDDYRNLSKATAATILRKIEEAGPREAAIRYGHELGACAICNRTLTNPDSIEAGIGPICATKAGW